MHDRLRRIAKMSKHLQRARLHEAAARQGDVLDLVLNSQCPLGALLRIGRERQHGLVDELDERRDRQCGLELFARQRRQLRRRPHDKGMNERHRRGHVERWERVLVE